MAPGLFAFPPASYFIFARFHAAYFEVVRWFYWPGRWLPAAIYVVADLAEGPKPKLSWTWPKGWWRAVKGSGGGLHGAAASFG